jgi:glycine hydroxymethyltransferase
MASLCATLIEHEAIGKRYSQKIREHTVTLSRCLADAGMQVLQDGPRVSETHQVFVHVPPDQLDAVHQRALSAGVTLNIKRKPLFRDTGIRLGVQEIARYRWASRDLERLAAVIAGLVRGDVYASALRDDVLDLAKLNVFAPELCFAPTEPRRGRGAAAGR